MLNIGGEFFVAEKKIIAIYPYKSHMAKAMVKDADESGYLSDCTGRRKTLSVILLSGEGGREIFLSPIAPKTLTKRLCPGIENNEPEQPNLD